MSIVLIVGPGKDPCSQQGVMRLVTFRGADQTRAGTLHGDAVVDLHAADSSLPSDTLVLIRGGPPLMDRAQSAVENAGLKRGAVLPLTEVTLLAPIPARRRS